MNIFNTCPYCETELDGSQCENCMFKVDYNNRFQIAILTKFYKDKKVLCQNCNQSFPLNIINEHKKNCQSNSSIQSNIINKVIQIFFQNQQAEQQSHNEHYEFQQQNILDQNKERIQSSYNSQMPTCPICLMELSRFDFEKTLNCNHKFHLNCINQWSEISNNCPICRREQL